MSPQKPPMPCQRMAMGCPHLRPCPVHGARRPWEQRLSRQARGYGAAWERIRPPVLREEPRCRWGSLPDEPGPCWADSTTVDHIVPKAHGGTDERANLRGLCREHQQRKAGREGQNAKTRGEQGLMGGSDVATRFSVYDGSGHVVGYAVVDDRLFALERYHWRVDKQGYVYRKSSGRRLMLHHIALGTRPSPEHEADHVNREKFDNRGQNLRWLTRSESAQNKGPQRRNRSGIRGAHWDRSNGRWKAEVVLDGRLNALGYYDTAEEAGRVAQAWRRDHMEGAMGARLPMGARLRELRQRRGLTLDEAGVVAGYTRSMMSKIERGKRPLSPEAAIRLARVLSIEILEEIQPAGEGA